MSAQCTPKELHNHYLIQKERESTIEIATLDGSHRSRTTLKMQYNLATSKYRTLCLDGERWGNRGQGEEGR